ncbi:MAG: hypothetical protein IJU57_04940 [Clostridia bacterium]|nr:hypothetical protein [Clostridia bacterium]
MTIFDPFITWWNGMTLLQQIFAACAIPATLILIIQSIMLIVGLTGNADSSDNGEGDHDSGDDADTDSPDTDGFDNDSDLDDTSDFDEASDADGLDDASDAGDTDMDDAGSGFDSDTDSDGDGIPDTDQGAGTNYHVSDRNDVNTVRHTGGHHSSGLRLFTIRGIVAFLAIGGWLGVSMIDLKLSPALTVAIAVAGGFAAMLLCALVIRWSVKLQENGTMSLKNAIAHTATVYIPIPPERHGFGKVTMTLQESYVELEAVTDCKDRIPTGTEVLVVGIADKNTLLVRPL